LFDELAKRESDIRELITSVPGFVAYNLVRTSDGMLTVTVCDSAEGTDASSERAAAYVRENMSQFLAGAPQITDGDVVFQFVNPAAAEAVLKAAGR
jgi:hypothetical protein